MFSKSKGTLSTASAHGQLIEISCKDDRRLFDVYFCLGCFSEQLGWQQHEQTPSLICWCCLAGHTGAPSHLVLNSSSPGQLMWGCRKDHSGISRTLDSSLRSKISAPKEVGVMSGSLYQTHCVTLGRLPDKTQPGELQRFWRPAQHRSGLREAKPEGTSSRWFGCSPVRFGTFGRCRGKDLSFHRKDKSFHRNE